MLAIKVICFIGGVAVLIYFGYKFLFKNMDDKNRPAF